MRNPLLGKKDVQVLIGKPAEETELPSEVDVVLDKVLRPTSLAIHFKAMECHLPAYIVRHSTWDMVVRNYNLLEALKRIMWH